ncbi:MAG: hypothetical protein V7K89_26895 [Nostoc sp.]
MQVQEGFYSYGRSYQKYWQWARTLNLRSYLEIMLRLFDRSNFTTEWPL